MGAGVLIPRDKTAPRLEAHSEPVHPHASQRQSALVLRSWQATGCDVLQFPPFRIGASKVLGSEWRHLINSTSLLNYKDIKKTRTPTTKERIQAGLPARQGSPRGRVKFYFAFLLQKQKLLLPLDSRLQFYGSEPEGMTFCSHPWPIQVQYPENTFWRKWSGRICFNPQELKKDH